MLAKRTVLEAKRYGVYQCNHSQTLAEAAQRMVEEDVSALVVVDDDGCLAGILSRTDLMRALMAQKDWKSEQVQSFMNNQVITVGPHATLLEVARLLLEHQIHRVVVVKNERARCDRNR